MNPTDIATKFHADLAALKLTQQARAEATAKKLDASRETTKALQETMRLQAGKDRREIEALYAQAGAALLGGEPAVKVRRKKAAVKEGGE